MRDTASSILYAFHRQRKVENIEEDKLNTYIIEAASKLTTSVVPLTTVVLLCGIRLKRSRRLHHLIDLRLLS